MCGEKKEETEKKKVGWKGGKDMVIIDLSGGKEARIEGRRRYVRDAWTEGKEGGKE